MQAKGLIRRTNQGWTKATCQVMLSLVKDQAQVSGAQILVAHLSDTQAQAKPGSSTLQSVRHKPWQHSKGDLAGMAFSNDTSKAMWTTWGPRQSQRQGNASGGESKTTTDPDGRCFRVQPDPARQHGTLEVRMFFPLKTRDLSKLTQAWGLRTTSLLSAWIICRCGSPRARSRGTKLAYTHRTPTPQDPDATCVGRDGDLGDQAPASLQS